MNRATALRTSGLVGLLALAPLLAACGDSPPEEPAADPTDPGASEPTIGETLEPEPDEPATLPPELAAETDDLRAAVRSFSDALLTGDGELAYAFYTEECQGEVPQGTYLLIVDRAGDVYGEPLPFATYDATVRGRDPEVAQVDYTFRGADGLVQDGEEWTRTDDGWRLSDC